MQDLVRARYDSRPHRIGSYRTRTAVQKAVEDCTAFAAPCARRGEAKIRRFRALPERRVYKVVDSGLVRSSWCCFKVLFGIVFCWIVGLGSLCLGLRLGRTCNATSSNRSNRYFIQALDETHQPHFRSFFNTSCSNRRIQVPTRCA